MKQWRRALSLILALVLFCSLIPMPAVAAQTYKTTGTFSYSAIDENDYSAVFFYDDDYFAESAYTYQDSLSTMTLCLAMSAFGSCAVPNTPEGYTQKSQNLRQLLSDCGFPDENFMVNEGFLTKPTAESIGIGASHKTITVDGTEYTLLAVAIRGASYESEWASNFTSGITGDHQGFAEARDQTLDFLRQYVADQKLSGPVKLWITGYSRGAMTANMTAAALDNGFSLSDSIQLSPDNIYAYCFECPQGVVSGDTDAELYRNIFNIVNPADIVTKIAPTQPEAFGFRRYGVTRYLPTALKSGGDYSALKAAMLEKYNALPSTTGYIVDDFQMKRIAVENLAWELEDLETEGLIVDDNDSPWDQNAFLDEFTYRLFSDIFINREHFVATYQADFRELFCILFGSEGKWDAFGDVFLEQLEAELSAIAVCLVLNLQHRLLAIVLDAAVTSMNQAGITDYSTAQVEEFAGKAVEMLLTFGVLHPDLTVTAIDNLGGIASAHYAELCLAWLQSFDPNYTPAGTAAFNSGVHRVVRVNGSVDVYIYDAEDALVAAILPDGTQATPGSSIVTCINDRDEKLVYLPADEAYRVELRATGAGTIDCAIQEFSEAAGGVNRIVHFTSLPLAEGEAYHACIPAIPETELADGCLQGSTAAYLLTDSDGNTLSPNADLAGSAAASASYQITVTSNCPEYGAVTGSGTLRLGEWAKLTAIPSENCGFEGWYEGDTLLSREETYRFCAAEDREIQAVFFHNDRAVTRISGKNRYETAEKTAAVLKEQLGVETFDAIVVASGISFADALSGSYLAAVTQAPVLLADPGSTASAAEYIAENLTSGGTVYLLGGTAAIPAALEESLKGFTIKRLSGPDRYATNLAVLQEAGISDQEILVCTGTGFADSLSASAAGRPILLVNDKLTDAQKDFLAGSSGKFVIIGGESAVSEALEAELNTLGITERISGANRYETSMLVARRFFETPAKAMLAYGESFPDGLCGGPLACQLGIPLILAAPGQEAAAAAYAGEQGITCGFVLGGSTLIPDPAVRKVFSLTDAEPILYK